MIENKQHNPNIPDIAKQKDNQDNIPKPDGDTSTPPNNRPSRKNENFVLEIIKIVFLAIIIVVPIRIFIAQPFVVSGASMDNTFSNGQYLIVDQLSYRFRKPERGDVIIFRFPLEPSKFFIKRVIGLPNETVILQGKATIIINKENPDGLVLKEDYLSPKNVGNNFSSTTLGDGEYFVMGDNRKESYDSRSWGILDKKYIMGRVFIRLFPLTSFNVLPGQ